LKENNENKEIESDENINLCLAKVSNRKGEK